MCEEFKLARYKDTESVLDKFGQADVSWDLYENPVHTICLNPNVHLQSTCTYEIADTHQSHFHEHTVT